MKEFGAKVNLGDITALTNRTPIIQDGELTGAMAIFQDISDLEQVSEELDKVKELNKELEGIIESVSDGLYITDGIGNTIRINSAYEKITGIGSKEVLGKHMKELVEEGVYSQSVTLLVLEEEEPVTIMHEIKTGKEVLITGNPVFNEAGEIVRVVTTVRDMEELNSLKEELEETKKLSKQYYSELERLREQQLDLEDVVIKSDEMEKIFNLALQVAKADSTVLVMGESGVGKEIIARTIHKSSSRGDNSLIKVNCGAIPDNLLEAELFGYEEGAFTGAKAGGKPGMFELADEGTLFLDEIGEMPINMQAKLLQVIQEHKVTRIGGVESIKVNFRLLTATNRNLKAMVDNKEFREDLYYRLNVVPIDIPPLRLRKQDILPLVNYYLNQLNQKYEENKNLSAAAEELMVDYNWPGNVRELTNLLERVILTTDKNTITDELLQRYMNFDSDQNQDEIVVNNVIPLKEAVSRVEKEILELLKEEDKTTYEMANILGVNQSTIVRKINKYFN
jgi:PAS domain S-box-containing protein